MKRVLIFVILIFFSYYTFGQKTVATQDQLKEFFKTKTLVVIDDNPLSEYNMEIKKCIERSWKLTDFDFIELDEFEKLRKDPAYSFLTVDKVYYEKDKTKATYEFLCLSLGGDYRTITDMPQLCTVPLCYYGTDEENYTYKIGTLINFIQEHILLTSKNPKLNSKNIISYYNKNLKSVKNKTLYLIKDEMAPQINTEAKVKAIYPYKFKFVTREEVREAIDRNDDNVVFLHKVGPEGTKKNARCFKVLLGAADAKLYYFNWHMINDKKPDGFLLKDLKKLRK
ncbi:MAG: hypothetical protein Kow0068_15430 [Marinilabiliales bacterium]